MRGKRVHVGVMVLGFFLAVGAAGCRSHASDPNNIRLRYWGDLDEVKITEGLIKDFEKAHPGVTVSDERKGADDSYSDILLQEFAAGTAPDVIFVDTARADILMASGRLMDLTPFMEKDGDLKKSDYYQSMIRRFSEGDRLMVLPRDIAPVACVYYNKDLFDAAHLAYPKDDWTWDDLRKDALALTRREEGGAFKTLGFADDNWNLIDAWILSGGGKDMDDYVHPTRFTFADPGALDGILFRYKLLQVDGVMPRSADNQSLNGGSAAMFTNGQLGMFLSGIWKTPSFRRITTFKWDVAPFPHRRGVRPLYFTGGSGYAIRAGVADPELCWKLVKFLAGPVGQTRFAATGLSQPALKALANSPVFLDGKDPKNKKMLLACAEHSLSTPQWKPWVEFQRTMWGPETDAMWVEGYQGDPAAVIQGLQKRANEKYFPGVK